MPPNLPAPTYLTDDERDEIRADLAALVDEANAGSVSVTYRRRSVSGSATYDPTDGSITDPYTSTTTTAIVGAVREEDAKLAGVELEATDRKFLLDRSDLGADPVAGDVIVYDGTAFEVIWVRHQAHTRLVIVYARVLGGET